MKPRNGTTGGSGDDDQQRLAVLIDADNAQPAVIAGLLAEVAKFGVASVKRIYGDFTSTHQTQWKKELLRHSISPVQQFAYTSGKNATDSSLIIDAMDLMYAGRFNGFCQVSRDSDFTRLAQRLREEGNQTARCLGGFFVASGIWCGNPTEISAHASACGPSRSSAIYESYIPGRDRSASCVFPDTLNISFSV